ncbi:MAG: hypothetical protein R3F11_12295 [Verrucomicrobiales bacterium]
MLRRIWRHCTRLGAVVRRGGMGGAFTGYSLRTPAGAIPRGEGGAQAYRELYDHDADASERTNLADAEAHAETIRDRPS